MTDDDTQCHTCSSDYYPLEESPVPTDNKKCYHKDRDGFYYSDETGIGLMHKCPEKCSKCKYAQIPDDPNYGVYCTECNNKIGFYQRERSSSSSARRARHRRL